MKIVFLAINIFAFLLPGIAMNFPTESLVKMSVFNLILTLIVSKLFDLEAVGYKAARNLLSSIALIYLTLVLFGAPLFM
jgi:hypothetical protein